MLDDIQSLSNQNLGADRWIQSGYKLHVNSHLYSRNYGNGAQPTHSEVTENPAVGTQLCTLLLQVQPEYPLYFIPSCTTQLMGPDPVRSSPPDLFFCDVARNSASVHSAPVTGPIALVPI